MRRAIQLSPDLAKAHYGLALALIGDPQNKLDWTGAIAECREALKYQPDYAEALNLLGAGLVSTAQPSNAILALEEAIRLSPRLSQAHFNLALALEATDRLEDAAKEIRLAISTRGEYPEASSALGSLLFRMGKTGEGKQEVETALRLDPDLTDAHYTLARILHSLGRDTEAANEFAEVKELSARQAVGIQSSQLSNQGLQLAAKGDMPAAAVLLRKAIALKPDYGVPHYNLGLILADLGDTGGALGEVTKAISLLPGQPKPWLELGRLQRRAKDDAAALESLTWAAHLSPADPAISAELASLKSGKFSGPGVPAPAAVMQSPLLGAETDTAADHLKFAEELSAHRDFQGAAGELLRCLSLEPALLVARRLLAGAFEQLGEHQRAMLEYRKVLLIAPGDLEAHICMGKILFAQGEVDEGLKQLREALRLNPQSGDARSALADAERAYARQLRDSRQTAPVPPVSRK